MTKISLKYKLVGKGEAKPHEFNLEELAKHLDVEDAEEVNKAGKRFLQYVENIYSQSKYKKIINMGVVEFGVGIPYENPQEQINRLKEVENYKDINLKSLDNNLSIRTQNALRAAKINTLGDVLEKGYTAMSKTRKIGKVAERELGNIMHELVPKKEYDKYINK